MRLIDLTEASKKGKKDDKPALRNPVAKFAGDFNKAQTFKDRTKYDRKEKHRGKLPEEKDEKDTNIINPELDGAPGDEDLHCLTDSCTDEEID